jgi:fibronectin-binding autotransporter adhesin
VKPRFWTFFLALAVSAAAPTVGLAQLVWDTSTASGFQNGNGTWGTDNFWTTNGTTLQAWNSANIAWFGGNGTTAASPSGNFTITVNGLQTANGVRQVSLGAGNFTLTGGTLSLPDGALRVDQGTLTINSVLTNTGGSVYHLNAQAGTTLILGGNNTFTTTPQIRGGAGGTVRLNHVGALGTSSTVQFVNGSVNLDLNGLNISGKTITIDNGQTGFLTNTAATKSVWSGNVDLSVGTGTLRAGGTGAEVEISGIISGANALQSMDNGVLRLTGNNTYTAGNSVRAGSTLIVGHTNALGAVSGTTFIGSSTLDLNGFDIGSRPVYFQQNDSKLVNDNTTTAAVHSGTLFMQFNRSNSQIGGAGDLTLSGNITLASGSTTGGGFTKAGAGKLTLSGSSNYTGSTTISAGTLAFDRVAALESSSGISIAAGTVLDYTGTAGTLSRNVTVSSSGTGTIRNSGGEKLTLSGTLTKDGRVLRLTGGVFDVTGRIVGASANSDLLVDGTSTVTLLAANTYVGPTFVNQASNLIVGINNAIPSNSVVTLGNATTTGTLSLGSFTNAIGGLAFGSGGGTLRLAATSTSAAPLTAATGTMTLTNGTLDLAGSGSTAGLYRVLSAQSVSGSFTSVTGASAAYQVITSATSVDYQQRAVLGAVTVTSPTVSIITGGSAAFTYTVANSALSGGADLGFSSGSLSNIAGSSSGTAAAAGTSGAISGLTFTGTSVGTLQQGTFTVSAPSAFGTTTSTGTVAVTVLDHATSSLGSGPSAVLSTVLNLGTWDYGSSTWTSGTSSGQFSIFNLASSFGSSLTADLSLVSVSGTGNGFTTNLGTYTDIAGGSSQQYSVFVNPASFLTSGTQSVTFTIAMSDKTGMAGATPSNTLSVTANVVVVPEPGALALAGLGIAAAWALRRRS